MSVDERETYTSYLEHRLPLSCCTPRYDIFCNILPSTLFHDDGFLSMDSLNLASSTSPGFVCLLRMRSRFSENDRFSLDVGWLGCSSLRVMLCNASADVRFFSNDISSMSMSRQRVSVTLEQRLKPILKNDKDNEGNTKTERNGQEGKKTSVFWYYTIPSKTDKNGGNGTWRQ